jgi:hypothetical protein
MLVAAPAIGIVIPARGHAVDVGPSTVNWDTFFAKEVTGWPDRG